MIRSKKQHHQQQQETPTPSTSTSVWCTRLENKLNSLTESSSKETYQTIAKWIAFNRKRIPEFTRVFKQQLLTIVPQQQQQQQQQQHPSTTSSSSQRQLLYMNVLHEVLMDEKPVDSSTNSVNPAGTGSSNNTNNTNKWDRLTDLRISIGENIVFDVADQLHGLAKEKVLTSMIPEWDEYNVFSDGHILLNQIKRKLVAQQQPKQPIQVQQPPAPAPVATTKATQIQHPQVEVTADIEGNAVPTKEEEEDQAGTNINDDDGEKEEIAVADEIMVAPKTKKKKKPRQDSIEEVEDNDQVTTTARPSSDTKKKKKQKVQEKKIEDAMDVDEEKLVSPLKPSPSTQSVPLMPSATKTTTPKTTPDVDTAAATAPNNSMTRSILPEEMKVEPREFLEHCKTIATLQIARDLRNDGAVQLSSLLSAMPDDIQKECKNERTAGNKAPKDSDNNNSENDEDSDNNDAIVLTEVQARDFSVRTNEILVDMDLEEQLLNIQTFRNVVDRQRMARQELIHLLLQSRCKFGSDVTAAAYYDAAKIKQRLQHRAHVLADAMELEGFDMEEDGPSSNNNNNTKKNPTASKGGADADEGLPPFPWYTSEGQEEAAPAAT